MKRNRRTALVFWSSFWIMFVGVYLFFFLLLPAKTTTFTGSSAHWKAQRVAQVQKLDEDFHMSSHSQLEVWWTGTSGDVMEAQYQLTGLHGVMEQASRILGPFHPWVSGYTGASEGLSDPERDWGFFLTITWKGGTETLHLQSH